MTIECRIAYIAYLAWLLAGLADFIAHRRTDLPHTSGVAESATHLIQLVLLAVAIVLVMGFRVNLAIAMVLLSLVAAHAVVGYVDTRFAFTMHRVVSPVEQHLHSVLDMAPIIAFSWLLASTWPASSSGGFFEARQPMVPAAAWCAVLVPGLAVCVLPALLEFRAAWKVRGMRST